MLASNGFRDARILSWVTGGTELAGGGLLVLGLFTPLAAAGVAAVMANVVLLKWHSGFFIPSRGFEYELVLAGVATGLAFTGPGRFSLDALLGLDSLHLVKRTLYQENQHRTEQVRVGLSNRPLASVHDQDLASLDDALQIELDGVRHQQVQAR